MFWMIICFFLFVFIISVGAATMKPWESGLYMMNAEWLADSEKFSLVSRWGRIA